MSIHIPAQNMTSPFSSELRADLS